MAVRHSVVMSMIAGVTMMITPGGLSGAESLSPLRFTGSISPSPGVDFNDPYRLTRRAVNYRVDLSLQRSGTKLTGILSLSDGQATQAFAVSGRTSGDIECEISAGPFRFEGLCASEGIVGQGSLSNMPTIVQLQGANMRGAWFAAAQGLPLTGSQPDLPQASCLLPNLNVSTSLQADAALRSALQASRSFVISAKEQGTNAFSRRAELLSELEPSANELAQLFKTFDNEQRMARRGMFNPRATQMATANRDAILNSPRRQSAIAELPSVMAAIAEAQSPNRRQVAERLAREAATAFGAWDRTLAVAAAALRDEQTGVRQALQLHQAIPGVEACAQALASFGAPKSGLRASLAGQVDRLAPTLVNMLEDAIRNERQSESLARQIDAMRGTALFAERQDVVAAFERADARVKTLASAEAEARRRLAAAAQAEQAKRRRQGYLTSEDLMEAFLTELDDITNYGERTGNVIRVSAPFLSGLVAYLGGDISNVSCTPGQGSSTCTYDFVYWMDSFGLRIPAMFVPVRRTDVFVTNGPIRSVGLRNFLIAMQSAVPSSSSSSSLSNDDPRKSMCQSLGAGVMAGGGDMTGSVGKIYNSMC